MRHLREFYAPCVPPLALLACLYLVPVYAAASVTVWWLRRVAEEDVPPGEPGSNVVRLYSRAGIKRGKLLQKP